MQATERHELGIFRGQTMNPGPPLRRPISRVGARGGRILCACSARTVRFTV